MDYQHLGYTDSLEKYRNEQGLEGFEIGRVMLEHKERYVVQTPTTEYDAELVGILRFTARDRYDFPAVGDWVAFSEYDEGKALIHAVYPRSSIIERQAVGTSGQVQIIATNIDYALIVQAVNRDFSINRLERYLTICNASGVEAVIILSKIDLIEDAELESMLSQIRDRIKDIPVLPLSNPAQTGLDSVRKLIQSGKTYCLLGSSGVGKSTLINSLTGKELMETAAISESVDRGKHITSHRELVVLEEGGIIIDNPGMREVGITDSSGGLEMTFDAILKLAEDCKYKDCTHTSEAGCAVLEALDTGVLDAASYENYQKMEKEKAFFESTVEEKKKKDKDLGKLIKHYKKVRKKDKY